MTEIIIKDMIKFEGRKRERLRRSIKNKLEVYYEKDKDILELL